METIQCDAYQFAYVLCFYNTQIGLAVGDIAELLQRAETRIESMKVSETVIRDLEMFIIAGPRYLKCE